MSEQVFVFRDGSVRTIDCEYCRELETTNWHYYKMKDGIMIHLRKDAIAMIVGGTYEDIVNNKPNIVRNPNADFENDNLHNFEPPINECESFCDVCTCKDL